MNTLARASEESAQTDYSSDAYLAEQKNEQIAVCHQTTLETVRQQGATSEYLSDIDLLLGSED